MNSHTHSGGVAESTKSNVGGSRRRAFRRQRGGGGAASGGASGSAGGGGGGGSASTGGVGMSSTSTARILVDDLRKKKHDAKSHITMKVWPGRRLLHGAMEIHILEARDLLNLDKFERVAGGLAGGGMSDPYVTVDVYRSGRKLCTLAKTCVIDDDLNPQWFEGFRVPVCHRADELRFVVKDMDKMSTERIGSLAIPAKKIKAGHVIEGWFDLTLMKWSPKACFQKKCRGSLRIRLLYKSVVMLPHTITVPGTVFPPRDGCNVRLYQDAHTPAVPPVTDVRDRRGNPYAPPSLWEDLADAIEKAEELIYIIGWSVKTDIRLRRDGKHNETLGDVLKRKASSGVRVLVMLWKEAMSTDIYPPGLMGTHDITTRNFFKGSEVVVLLAPRKKFKAKRMFEGLFVETAFTHHQKCVILDAPGGREGRGDRRRLVAFAGGIDLTDGRWDTPSHELFKTLPNEHKHDFYNGSCPSANVWTGPRQPWHDIHMFVEGPVVFDLLINFNQRWMRQAGRQLQGKLFEVNEMIFDLDATVEENDDVASWNVQLFRSIGSDSAIFDPDTSNRLMASKGRQFESSIQNAYIHQIRRASNFIYFENQYFLGSSHGWSKKETSKCPHLIPLEITRRIIRAIENHEDFRVYITIPLHPEGDPAGATVQEILRWQYRTLEMMYRKIAKAIEKNEVDAHPCDYLSFFCLGKREDPGDVPPTLGKPSKKSVAAKVRESLRFMIYVHSKFAIFDDEYVIVGTANINERSMAGFRDSEMALGAHQPMFTKATTVSGKEVEGDIRTFRLALWAEHCGTHMEEHKSPASLSCMHAMKQLGDKNLAVYISNEVARSDSHLMTYPLIVTKYGYVHRRLDNLGRFPDTGGSTKGHNSWMLPNSITT